MHPKHDNGSERMANAWPDDLWSLLGIAPWAEDPPGFRVGGNDASGDTQLDNFAPTFPGLIPAPGASPPDAIGFNEPSAPIDNDPQSPDADGPFGDGAFPPYPSPPSFPPLQVPGPTTPEQHNWTWTPPPPVPGFNVVPPAAPLPAFRMPIGAASRTAPPTIGLSAFGGGSPSPYTTPSQLPRMAPPSPWAGLRSGGGVGGASPYTQTPGFNIVSPFDDTAGFRVPTNNGAQSGLSNATNFAFAKHDTPTDLLLPNLGSSDEALYSLGHGPYPAFTPAVLPTFPAVPARETFDDSNVDSRLLPAITLGIDPQYIIPVQSRPPPTHNGGPPLRPPAPAPLPTQPFRGGLPQGVPLPSTTPDASSTIAGAAAAGTTTSPAQEDQAASIDSDHQSDGSLIDLMRVIKEAINEAEESGRLSPDVAQKARANVQERNLDIYTVGTGNAHGGVAQSMRDGELSEPRRK
jgi:hypothetical protein